MRPLWVSETKMSPFGAVLIARGPFNPSTSSSTLKPAGTLGVAPAGCGTTRETLADEAVAPGFGRSVGRIRRTTPGRSARQPPNAALPASGSDCAGADPVPVNSVAARTGDKRARRDNRALG